MNEVNLNFPKDMIRITGRDYGKEIYETQIAGRLDLSKNFTIVFPKTIVNIGISFVQGMFLNIVEQIGLQDTLSRVSVLSSSDSLSKKVISDIML